MTFRLPPVVERELQPITGRWRIEQGKKHYKLLIDGYLITVFPRKGLILNDGDRGNLNTRTCIRRYLGRHP